MGKHFLVNPNVEVVGKEAIIKIQSEKEIEERQRYETKISRESKVLAEIEGLKHVDGKVIIKINMDSKDSWTFGNGKKIEYRRRFNNLNVRETNPVNAIVISGDGIKEESEVLIHPNSIQDSNRIFDYKNNGDTIRYYSIHRDMCFAWHNGKEWQPLPPYDFALRVFQPHKGVLQNIAPTLIPDVLYVTTGELKSKVVKTIKASDYCIVFQDTTGREGNLIRFRPFGDPKTNREEEAIAILNDLTDQVNKGKLLVGIDIKDAKPLKEYTHG